MTPAAKTPLARWRIARAAVMAFLVAKFAGWKPLSDAPTRSLLAIVVMAVAFVFALRFERWIQSKREEAERPSDP
ncbi:MAG: hypothetical protein RL272_209 [Candidatus Parcubacteria bacterium]|jgi:predicted membrane metal-binding protein